MPFTSWHPVASSQFILVLLGSLSDHLSKQPGGSNSWDNVDTQQREGRAGYCLPPIRSEALDEVFASPLTPGPWLQVWWREEPGCNLGTQSSLWSAAATDKCTRKRLSRQERRESSPRQCHLCLLFSIRQKATASVLFRFRIYFTCLHCSLVSNPLQIRFGVEWRKRNFGLVPT